MSQASDSAKFQQDISSRAYFIAASLGVIPGVSTDVKFGHSPVTGVERTDIWERGESQPLYIYPSDEGEGVTMVSDNPADTMDIEVTGLDETGAPKTQTKTLTGTTPVALYGLWRSVSHASNEGATEFIGAVTIQGDGGVSTNVFASLGLDDQKTSQAIYLVPSNKVAIVINYSTAINKSTGVSISTIFAFRVARPGGIFRTEIRYGLEQDGTSNISSNLVAPVMAGPLCKIKVSAFPSFADTDISAEFSMLLIDKDLIPPALLAQLETP